MFENTPAELLELFEDFCDPSSSATLHGEVQFPCSASSNSFARQTQRWLEDSIVNAKCGGCTEAVRGLLDQGPTSAQPYRSSPYLEVSLFSCNDKWVSVTEQPRAGGDCSFRFYTQDPGLPNFQVYTGSLGLSITHAV